MRSKTYPHPHLVFLLKFVISKRRSNLYATKKQYNTAFLYKLIVNIVQLVINFLRHRQSADFSITLGKTVDCIVISQWWV